MTVLIKDMPRFHADCLDYQRRIESIENENYKKQAQAMFETFMNAVQALDQSVENLVESGPVFGNEHQLLRETLTQTRLDLVRWLNKHSNLEKIPVK